MSRRSELFGAFSRAVAELESLGDPRSRVAAERLKAQLAALVSAAQLAVDAARCRNLPTPEEIALLEKLGLLREVRCDGATREYSITHAGKVLFQRKG